MKPATALEESIVEEEDDKSGLQIEFAIYDYERRK